MILGAFGGARDGQHAPSVRRSGGGDFCVRANQQLGHHLPLRRGGGAAGRGHLFLAAVLLLAAAAPNPPAEGNVTVTSSTQGTSYYVSTQGSDGNPGTISAPFRTVGYGLTRLAPGDILYIREGTYYERPTVSVSGTASERITIRSYPQERAVIASGGAEFRTPGNSDWDLVNASLGEYRSVRTYSSGAVRGYVAGIPGYENERVALVPYTSSSMFRATTDQYVDGSTPFYVGPGTYYDPSDSRIHIRLSKTTDLKATEARYGQVFPTDSPDPRSYSIILSQAPSTFTVSGSYLTFQDLTFDLANDTVVLSSGVHHILFDGVTIWIGDSGLAVGGSGVHDITVANSRVYGDNPYWIFWSDMKDPPAPADLLRSTSIDLRYGSTNWEIHHSHLRGSGQDLIGTNTNEDNVIIHHNRIENCGDDAFELEGTTDVKKISIYENYIGNCLVAISPGQDTPTFTGPLLVYRNAIVLLRNPPVNRKAGINSWNGGGRFGYEYMFKQSGSSYSTANAHYYHNTLIMLSTGSGNGMAITPQNPARCYFANNLLVMVNGLINNTYRTGSGQIVNGDLYWKMNTVDATRLLSSYDTVPAFSAATGLEANGIGSVPKRGTDPKFATFNPGIADKTQTTWELRPDSEVYTPPDLFLSSFSPAIGAGIVIPPHPTLGTLPDTRNSRDIGAYPYGTSAPEYSGFPFVPGGVDITPPARVTDLSTSP